MIVQERLTTLVWHVPPVKVQTLTSLPVPPVPPARFQPLVRRVSTVHPTAYRTLLKAPVWPAPERKLALQVKPPVRLPTAEFAQVLMVQRALLANALTPSAVLRQPAAPTANATAQEAFVPATACGRATRVKRRQQHMPAKTPQSQSKCLAKVCGTGSTQTWKSSELHSHPTLLA